MMDITYPTNVSTNGKISMSFLIRVLLWSKINNPRQPPGGNSGNSIISL